MLEGRGDAAGINASAASVAGCAARRDGIGHLAPELLSASAGGVPSFASDLWSLGCLLYEAFTGR